MRLLSLVLALLVASSTVAAGADSADALWDMDALDQPPPMTWTGHTAHGAKGLLFEGEPYRGKPTRVFAWYAVPENAGGRVPAIVLVHGGDGRAFSEWCDLWAKRGYAAIAMNLNAAGHDNKPLDDGGPRLRHEDIFVDVRVSPKEAWPYHAVANVIRAHSLIRSFPEVDADRTGITGISWGGYVTCLAVGIDHRFRVAVPVYGCGFLHENSAWLNEFKKLGPEASREWVKRFDPSNLLNKSTTPLLFVNGTNDFAYPLDSYRKSYRLVDDRTLCVRVGMPHGHQAGWRPKEIGIFVDGYLAMPRATPLAKVSMNARRGADVSASVCSTVPIQSAELHYTTDQGDWRKRKWQTVPAELLKDAVRAQLPAENGIVFFFTATDARGVTVSTEHEVIE